MRDDGKTGQAFPERSRPLESTEPSGAFCIYPPQVLSQVDVTEQSERDTVRYVVRNRANSRYCLLKRLEFEVFSRIDGTRSLDVIAARNDQGPRASRQAVIKFLSKLDSLGLLAHGGTAVAARPNTGLY